MRTLEALQRFSLAISPSQELEQLLPCILQSTLELARAHAGALLLCQAGGAARPGYEMEIGAVYNLDQDPAALGASPGCLESLQAHRPVSTQGSSGCPAVFIPLRLAGETAGVVYLERSSHSQPFGPEDQRVLEIALAQAALAIQYARQAAQLQQANEARAGYVSKVTHELRIPMTSLKGYTHLILQEAAGPVTEQQANFLTVIANNVERMSDLVTNLADITLLETGHLQPKTVRFPLQSAMDSALQRVQTSLQEKEQTIEVRLPVGRLEAYADPERVGRVLAILLSNASRYTPVSGKVSLHARPEEQSVYVEVADTGIGIDAQDQEQLFQPFFRSEDPQVREYAGWGLELYLARLLVGGMGGKISASSLPGQGSAFWFTLPAPPA